jgi:hypothetical protein
MLISLIEQHNLSQFDKLPVLMNIDTAACNIVSGVVTVSGWALNISGLAEINVCYDQKNSVAKINSFTDRQDSKTPLDFTRMVRIADLI